MSRSVFIAIGVGAALVLIVLSLRLGEAPSEEPAATGASGRVARERDDVAAARADAQRDAPVRQRAGGSAVESAEQERRRDGRPESRGDGRPDELSKVKRGERRADARGGAARASGSGRPDASGGLGGRMPAGQPRDDEGFKRAAEALPERDSQLAANEPAADDEDEDVTADADHEPPQTPVVDDDMTYNSGDYRFSMDSPFQIPNSGEAGTVALWVQPEWSADNKDDADIIELGDGLFRVYKNVNVLRFEVLSDADEHSAGVSIADWQPGEWHSISATWEGQDVTFYVDGQPVRGAIPGSFDLSGNQPVTIGTLKGANPVIAPGTLSDISLRNRALPASEIARLYNRSAVPKR